MFLIKKCTQCDRKLRFPIDKGKLKVTCVCGQTFIADPDNPELFKGSEIDIKPDRIKEKSFFRMPRVNIRDLFDLKKIIGQLYNTGYRLQNFKILPASEQRKIILHVVCFLLIAVMFIFFMCGSKGKIFTGIE